jgi:hypothetical protein
MTRPSVKSIAIGVAALTITFVIGGAATYVFNRVYVRFEKVGMGSTRMEPAGRGSVSAYRASDGVNVVFNQTEFPSAAYAKTAFENILGDSKKIISREFVKDREGKFVVGERVLGLFPADDGRESPLMVCLDGTRLYTIASTSERHILMFEKRHRRY